MTSSQRQPAPFLPAPSRLRRFVSAIWSRLAGWLGLWWLLYAIAGLCRRHQLIVVFTFHRVTDSETGSEHLVTYDRGITAATFDMQLTEIRRRFEVISLAQLIDILTGRTKPGRNACLLTFDDADSEFISAAYPVLARHGVPAVVFAPTAYIGSTRRFWHLRVSNAFQRAIAADWPRIQALSRYFSEPRRHWLEGLDLNSRQQRGLACWRFNIALDVLSDQEIEVVLAKLEEITGPAYELGIECMTWEQLRWLEQHGIAIESHAVTHRKLGKLSPPEVEQELIQSRFEIESQLAKTVTSVCYPAGSYNPQVAKAAQAAGYRVGFITKFGPLDYPKSGVDLLTLTRFDMRGSNRYEAARFLGGLPWHLLR